MGIEAIGRGIGSVGRAASVAPSIGRAASIGPSLGRISMIGRSSFEGGFSVSRIANPFKAAGSLGGFAENRGPSLLNPLGIETIRNPFIVRPLTPRSPLRAADVIAEAEAIVSRVQRKPIKISGWTGNLVRAPEPAVVSRVARITATPTQSQISTEQIVEEKKILAEREQKDKSRVKRSEKQSVAKIKIVEAVRITQLRRSAIFEAAKKVKEEAEKKGEKVVISGKKLMKFLSAEFWKYISPLVGREGHDGTIPLTLNALENNPTEYTNLEEAQTRLSQPVAEHIPLEKGEGGRGYC